MLTRFPKPIRKFRLIAVGGSGLVAAIGLVLVFSTFLSKRFDPAVVPFWLGGFFAVQMTSILVAAWLEGRYLRSVSLQCGCVCTNCGYPLPKDNLNGQCPECGRVYRLEEERAIWQKARVRNCGPRPEK